MYAGTYKRLVGFDPFHSPTMIGELDKIVKAFKACRIGPTKLSSILFAFFLLHLLVTQSVSGQSPSILSIADQFKTQGLEATKGTWAKIPEPLLAQPASAEQKQKILETVAGKDSWEAFSRNSLIAPVAVRIEPVEKDGMRVAHSIHSAFVVHATIEALRDRDLMESIFGKPSENSESQGMTLEELKPEEWQAAGISKVESKSHHFVYLKFMLLNRVEVEGVVMIERNQSDDSIYLCWLMDERFQNAKPHRNAFTKWDEDEFGKKKPGEPQSYSGCGGYLSVTRLENPSGSVLIESHLVIHEPESWFRGSNQLRSKLPITIQENARSFRRKFGKK